MQKIKAPLFCFFCLLIISIFSGCAYKSENPIEIDDPLAEYNFPIIEDIEPTEEPKNETIIYVALNGLNEYKLEYMGALTPQILLEGLGNVLQVPIDVNKAEVLADRIVIDFKPSSAPISAPPSGMEGQFHDTNEYIFGVLDSIKATFHKHYGQQKEIYMSVEGKACLFQNANPQFKIQPDKPYMGSAYIKGKASE